MQATPGMLSYAAPLGPIVVLVKGEFVATIAPVLSDLPIKPPYDPMEAERVSEIPAGEGWQYEPKWDGFRALVFRSEDEIYIQSKAGQPLGRYFPELVDELLKLKQKHFVLDGEITISVGGRLSFDDLLLRIHPAATRVKKLAAESPAKFFAFDLLAEETKSGIVSIAESPLTERRERLESFFASVPDQSGVRLSPATEDPRIAKEWFEDFGALGLDGVMAKRSMEPYHSGDRDGMVKVKHFNTADCVVGGFRYATGSKAIGSLLLGLYDDAENLVFIGHTSSFKRQEKIDLKEIVEPLIGENPFSIRVPGGPSRWATEKTGEWSPLEPKLVIEVEFDYFSQGRFRHGSRFLRWRPDKKPKQCTMGQVDPKKRSSKVLKNLGME